jgi:hypothetical protein
MTTLTRHSTFRSLKQNTSTKVKKVTTKNKKAEAEMEAFLLLISNIKVKKV